MERKTVTGRLKEKRVYCWYVRNKRNSKHSIGALINGNCRTSNKYGKKGKKCSINISVQYLGKM